MAIHQSPILNIMMKAAEKASRTLLRDFGEVEQLQVSRKGPGDFVSAADKRAEKTIYEELKYAHPTYSFLMEESGSVKGENTDFCWIIDPLDGTMNFLHGLPHWCISIALEVKGEVTHGLVYDPVKDEMFTAEKGKGAFIHRNKRLRVSGRRDNLSALVLTGAPRRLENNHEEFFREQRAVWEMGASLRRYGAAALDLTYIAAGRAEAFWERSLKEWDVAAGILIVKESGGFVCDFTDHKANPNKTGNVLAANESMFTDLKKTLKNA